MNLDYTKNIYGSKFISEHQDDCFYVLNRNKIFIFKDFINDLILSKNEKISVEIKINDKLRRYCNLIFLHNFGCRINGYEKFRFVPFFDENDLDKLKSYEYNIEY